MSSRAISPMDPVVTTIIPTYNRSAETRRAIESVLNQTYNAIELIIVDDGSTPPISQSIAINSDEANVNIIAHESNRGANVARNTGIDAAHGEYIAFLDSDDEWVDTKIERQLTAIHNTAYEAAYTSVKHVNPAGELNGISQARTDGNIQRALLKKNVVGSFSTLLISRTAIDEVGRTDPSLPCWQDWEWYLRLSQSVDFHAINEPLTISHSGSDQISRNFASKREVAYPIMKQRISEYAPNERTARIALAYLDFQLGYAALVHGRYDISRSQFFSAIRAYPWEPSFYQYLICAGPQYSTVRSLKHWLIRLTVA